MMDKTKIQKLKQLYKTAEERRKFLKYLKNIDAIVEKNPNYNVHGPLLDRYSKAVEDRYMPDVKKARKEISFLWRVYSSYDTVTNRGLSLNNNTRIFYQVRDLTFRIRKLRKLHSDAKKRGIRITKNVRGKRVYKTEKELKRELR
jgi:hypothetical protein